jgi:hypothetical protein
MPVEVEGDQPRETVCGATTLTLALADFVLSA